MICYHPIVDVDAMLSSFGLGDGLLCWVLLLFIAIIAMSADVDEDALIAVALHEPFRGTIADYSIANDRESRNRLGKWYLPSALRTELQPAPDCDAPPMEFMGPGTFRGIALCTPGRCFPHPSELFHPVRLGLRDYLLRVRGVPLSRSLWMDIVCFFEVRLPTPPSMLDFRNVPKQDCFECIPLAGPLASQADLLYNDETGAPCSIVELLDFLKLDVPSISVAASTRHGRRLVGLQVPLPLLDAIHRSSTCVLVSGDLWLRSVNSAGTMKSSFKVNSPIRDFIMHRHTTALPPDVDVDVIHSLDPGLFRDAAHLLRFPDSRKLHYDVPMVQWWLD